MSKFPLFQFSLSFGGGGNLNNYPLLLSLLPPSPPPPQKPQGVSPIIPTRFPEFRDSISPQRENPLSVSEKKP